MIISFFLLSGFGCPPDLVFFGFGNLYDFTKCRIWLYFGFGQKKSNLFSDNNLDNLLSTLINNTECHQMNHKTASYHAYDMVTSGKRYIINQMFGKSYCDVMQSDTMTNFEINCQIVLARFSTKLTRSMQKEFGEVLSFMKQLIEEKTICQIPTSYACLRRMYIDGDAAISRNMPIPDVKSIQGHSYVSIVDCVADFLIRKHNIISDINNWDDA